jgi:hypothetical protein
MRLCGICTDPRRKAIDRFMARGLPYKAFHAKFPEFSNDCWGRHKNHIVDKAAQVFEAVERAAKDGAPGNEANLRHLLVARRKLHRLAAAAERSGRIAHAINAYAASARIDEILQRLRSTNGGAALSPPVINIAFRSVEEVELVRAQARQSIREIEPNNAVLTDLENAEAGVLPTPQPRPVETKAISANLTRWAALGKDDVN